MKNCKKEMLIKFNTTQNMQEIDELIYLFEDKINQIDENYYLKESENPFIYVLEYPNPSKLIKKMEISEEKLENMMELIPVTCVNSNTNYVISTILNKIRHKISYNDTFKVTCHLNPYDNPENKIQLEKDISSQIQNIIKIPLNKNNPLWDIHLYIIGDITGINIKKADRHNTN